MITQEQVAARQKGIGGSDAGVILGVNPYKSARELYHEKRGEIQPRPMTDAMWFGQKLEPVIAEKYRIETGRPIISVADTVVHPKHQMILGHLDYRTDDRIIECKTVGARSAQDWGEAGTDEVPLHYLAQGAHYALLTGVSLVDFAVLIAGQDFRIYTVRIPETLQGDLLKAELDFWDRVESGNPPDIRAADAETLRRVYWKDDGRMLAASDRETELVNDLRSVRNRIAPLEDLEKRLKVELQSIIGAASGIAAPDGKPLVTWKKSQDREIVDWEKAFYDLAKLVSADASSAILETYKSTEPGSRRFLIK